MPFCREPRRSPIIRPVSSTTAAIRRTRLLRLAAAPGVAGGIALVAALLVALIVAARFSVPLFLAFGIGLLLTLALVGYRHPRGALLAVVFTPILDRYFVTLLVPDALHGVTNYLSEALLLVVATSIGIRAWQGGRLVAALRHPTLAIVAAFALLAGVSAVINGVPPLIALAGIAFTVDAVVLFVLPRTIPVDAAYARVAMLAFVAMATVAALLALGQVHLHADLLGMASVTGAFSEGRRVAAFLVNPNMLGVILAMAIPLPLLATVRADQGRQRVVAGITTFVLTLALLYTFSRGAWLGLGAAVVVISLLVDRRAVLAMLLLAVVAYGTAVVVPRHMLQAEPGDSGFDLGAATIGRVDALGDGTDMRVQYATNGLPIILDHPVLGAGPGRYGGAVAWRFGSPLYDRYTDGAVPRDRTVDNFWLHLTAESGILGALLFAAAVAAAVGGALAAARRLDGWPRILAAGAAAIGIVVGVDSLTEMLLEGNTTAFAAWFFLGVASVLTAGAVAGEAQ
jgi:O-antigen ligase